jgi:hypothetical protein
LSVSNPIRERLSTAEFFEGRMRRIETAMEVAHLDALIGYSVGMLREKLCAQRCSCCACSRDGTRLAHASIRASASSATALE